MRFVALWKTGRATVPETPVEFVDGLGRRIESVDGVTSVGQRSHLTPIVRMSKGRGHEMGFPCHPFEGRWRLIDTPTAWRQWVRRYRLQADAIVIWSKGSNPALALNSRLNVIHPCLRSRTSDLQYSSSSCRKSSTYPSRVSFVCQRRKASRSSTDIPSGM